MSASSPDSAGRARFPGVSKSISDFSLALLLLWVLVQFIDVIIGAFAFVLARITHQGPELLDFGLIAAAFVNAAIWSSLAFALAKRSAVTSAFPLGAAIVAAPSAAVVVFALIERGDTLLILVFLNHAVASIAAIVGYALGRRASRRGGGESSGSGPVEQAFPAGSAGRLG